MRHTRHITWQAHDQLSRLVWSGGLMIPLVVLGLAVSVPFWRTVAAEAEQVVSEQIDAEDGELCVRFGFPAFGEKHAACKAELLALRQSHAKLLSASSVP